MKLYRRQEFLKLPAGTIYAKGKQWYFDSFGVKGATLGNDFACLSPMWPAAANDTEQFERLEAMLNEGVSFPMEEDFGRDGCFNDDDIFLVAEAEDLLKLRALIDAAMAN